MSRPTLEEQFEKFHQENPGVYEELRRLSLQLVDRGLTRFGIATVYETLRYRRLETTGDDFRLNNNHRSFYARMLMEREPRLRGVFPTRDLRAKRRMPEAPEHHFEPHTGQGLLA